MATQTLRGSGATAGSTSYGSAALAVVPLAMLGLAALGRARSATTRNAVSVKKGISGKDLDDAKEWDVTELTAEEFPTKVDETLVDVEQRHYVIGGSVTVTEGGKATTAGTGDLLIVPKGSKVSWEFQLPFKNHATWVGPTMMDDDYKGDKCKEWVPEFFAKPYATPTDEESAATWGEKCSNYDTKANSPKGGMDVLKWDVPSKMKGY